MKYFFLSEGWTIGRVWELGGLWNQPAWQRSPQIQKLGIGILERQQKLWLYQVEDAVLMVEVKPARGPAESSSPIGQVVLKRLISADQTIAYLNTAETIFSTAAETMALPEPPG
uniref:Uncharacterized protein n=1 Tax=Cyanothece sp. (strain PCC 7425 / ATCC 29141) TaxID=395961 RepID=B8HWX3_CYAP4